jgi:hypothetical protein
MSSERLKALEDVMAMMAARATWEELLHYLVAEHTAAKAPPTPVQPVAQLGDGVFWCDTCRSVQETIHHTSPNDRDVWCKGEAAWLQGPFYTTPPAQPAPVQEKGKL